MPELKTGSAAWHEERRSYIGASEAAAVVGLDRFKTAVEVWHEKRALVVPKPAGAAAEWGTLLEPLVAAEAGTTLTQRLGRPMKPRRARRLFRHHVYPFLGAHLDRVIEGTRDVLEIKTTGYWRREEWGREWSDDVPEAVFVQVQHQMAVTSRERAWIAVLIGGQDLRFYHVLYDPGFVMSLLEAEAAFWELVQSDRAPDPTRVDDQDSYATALGRLASDPGAGEARMASDREIDIAERLRRARHAEARVHQLVGFLTNQIRARLASEDGVTDLLLDEDARITYRRNKASTKTDWQGAWEALAQMVLVNELMNREHLDALRGRYEETTPGARVLKTPRSWGGAMSDWTWTEAITKE